MKPKVFRAILAAILALIIYTLIYLLVFLVLGFAILYLSEIPILGTIIEYFFYLRRDTPDLMLSVLAPSLGCFIAMAIQEKIAKHKRTIGLSYILFGVFLVLLHTYALLLNLSYNAGILKNIIQIIAGAAVLVRGRNLLRDPDPN